MFGTMRRGYLIIVVTLIGVVVGATWFNDSSNILVFDLEIKSDASDPYPSLRFGVSNQGDEDVIAIRASINEVDLPYTFGVSEEYPLIPSRTMDYSGYTGWYEPGGGVGGFIPDELDRYRVRLVILLGDGSTRVFKKSGIFRDSHMASSGSIGGQDTLGFGEADLMAIGVKGTLNLHILNDWTIGASQTVKRLELHVEDRIVWEEDVRIKHTRCFAVTVMVPFELEPGQYYDVSLVAYSTVRNVSTFTKSTLCQKYEIG